MSVHSQERIMDSSLQANPILPGAGVPRNSATGAHTSSTVEPDDAVLPNPTGRGKADSRRGSVAKILRCKRPLRIATFNIQTLNAQKGPREKDTTELKTEELAWNMKEQNVEICGLQEHRQVHTNDRNREINRYSAGSGYELYTASAWRNSSQAANGGVGIIIGRTAQKLLTSVDRISDRVLKATFQGNPALTAIVAYAPCEYAEDSEKTQFYEQLRLAIESTPAHHFLAVLGDFNARLGADDVLYTLNRSTNDNGKRLLEIMEDHQLLAANTIFRKRHGKLWTWLSPSNRVQQIDYILTRRKWRTSVTNCEAYSSFMSLGSDHRVVTANVKLSLRAPRKETRKSTRYIWSQLANDAHLQQRYAVEIRNRFQVLEEAEDISAGYERFIEANQAAAETCLPEVPKIRRKERCLDPRVVKAREIMQTSHREFTADRTGCGKREMYQRSKEELYRVYAVIEQEELTRKVSEVEEAHNNLRHAQSWKLINEISGRKSSQSAKINGKSAEERVGAWKTHFKNLLGSPPVVDNEDETIPQMLQDLPIPDGPFSMEEYQKAKASIKCGKSCGEDGVTPEVLKYVPVDDLALDFINRAYESGKLPEKWSILNIVPVPKSGDLTKTDNYRGISLSSLLAKTFNRMLLNRLRPALDPLLRTTQNGFRQKRTTVEQIVALRRILEGVRERNLPAVITFIDFRKAFDTVHRGKMVKILRAYGIPEKVTQAIAAGYASTRAKVLSPDGETDYFDILAGVLQGDTLAPYLFIITLDYSLRRAISGREEELGFTLVPRKSRRVKAVMVTDYDFADDIALISDTAERARLLLLSVERECKKIGLQLNAKKTKVMALNTEDKKVCTGDGTALENVEGFKYLGAHLESSENDIRVRKALAWKALHSMRRLWRSDLGDDLKRRLFVATVESVLLYGAETWTLTVQQERSLDGTFTRMLRMALNATWEDRILNTDLYGTLPKVSAKIRERRMRLAGHCARHPDLEASKTILWEPTQGHARRGKRRTTLIDTLKRDSGASSTEELRTLMLEREEWRARIQESRDGVG